MRTRLATCTLALAAALALGGCMISTQDGERTHVNSKPPDRMTFHFDTGFNQAMTWGRSGALVLLGVWFGSLAERRKRNAAFLVVTLPIVAGAGWLLLDGLKTLNDYRIDVTPDRVVIAEPGAPEASFTWDEIEALCVEGVAWDINTGIKTYEEYERMEIHSADGRRRAVDLTPLSPEQRGTLWIAIANRAGLAEQR